jgi:hypothetical protein
MLEDLEQEFFDKLEVPYTVPRGVHIIAMELFLEGVEEGFFEFDSVKDDDFFNVTLFGPKTFSDNKAIKQAFDLVTYADFCNENNIELYLSAKEAFSDKITIHLIDYPIKAAAVVSWENNRPEIIDFKYNMYMTLSDERVEAMTKASLSCLRLREK